MQLKPVSTDSHVPFPVLVGRVYAALRQGAGVSQRGLAEKIGLPQSSIAWIERGRTMANAGHLYGLEQWLVQTGELPHFGISLRVVAEATRTLRSRGTDVLANKAAAATKLPPLSLGHLDRVVGACLDRVLSGEAPV